MYLLAIYIFPGSVYLFAAARDAGRSWEYINRLQIHECRNWEWGRAFSFLGMRLHKSDFRYSALRNSWNWGQMRTLGVRINEVLPWLVRWARRASKKIDSWLALAALVSPVQNIISVSSPQHFFTLLVPIAQQPGQAVVLGRRSLCLWLRRDKLITGKRLV